VGLFTGLFGGRPASGPRGVVAIWPTSGGPGASTVASSLAALFAGRARTILVDCDQTRGTLENLLRPLPGVTLGAAVAARPYDDEPLPDGMLYQTRWDARFLPGLVGPAAPVSVDPAGLFALLARLRRECDVLALDLGEELPSDLEAAARAVWTPQSPQSPQSLQPLQSLQSLQSPQSPPAADAAGPPREAALPPSVHERPGGPGHAAALWLADVVVVVARDTPQGQLDLRGEYPLLHRVLSRAPRPPSVGVVVNELATGHIDRWAELLRKEGLPFWGHVPRDEIAARRSWSSGAPLAFADPHSKAAKALVALAGAVEVALGERAGRGAGADPSGDDTA